MIKNVESKSCGSGHWASTKNTQSLMPPHEYANFLLLVNCPFHRSFDTSSGPGAYICELRTNKSAESLIAAAF